MITITEDSMAAPWTIVPLPDEHGPLYRIVGQRGRPGSAILCAPCQEEIARLGDKAMCLMLVFRDSLEDRLAQCREAIEVDGLQKMVLVAYSADDTAQIAAAEKVLHDLLATLIPQAAAP